MTKTKPCDRAHAAARLAIAVSFIEAAESPEMLAQGTNPYRANARVANYVQAGIAAGDAICCIELKEHSSVDSHATAINLIKKVAHDGAELAKALGTLLALKTDASYGSGPMKAANAARNDLPKSSSRQLAIVSPRSGAVARPRRGTPGTPRRTRGSR